MQRFILSVFSVVLVAASVVPTAQAVPKVDPGFDVQTLRLREFDARNKSDDGQQPYYSETSTQAWPQESAAEQESIQTIEPTVEPTIEPTVEPTVWESPETQEEAASPVLSLIQRRQQSLDRS